MYEDPALALENAAARAEAGDESDFPAFRDEDRGALAALLRAAGELRAFLDPALNDAADGEPEVQLRFMRARSLPGGAAARIEWSGTPTPERRGSLVGGEGKRLLLRLRDLSAPAKTKQIAFRTAATFVAHRLPVPGLFLPLPTRTLLLGASLSVPLSLSDLRRDDAWARPASAAVGARMLSAAAALPFGGMRATRFFGEDTYGLSSHELLDLRLGLLPRTRSLLSGKDLPERGAAVLEDCGDAVLGHVFRTEPGYPSALPWRDPIFVLRPASFGRTP